jgi:hypothetical protein
MFSFYSNRRALRRGAFALLFVFCLSASLFTSCENGTTTDDTVTVTDSLLGKWESSYGDFYDITSIKLFYDDNYSGKPVGGTIRHYEAFDGASGVFIVEYDADHKATYWEYDENWNPISELPLKGDFIGIYYKDLQSGVSVQMGSAYADGGAEQATLNVAIKAFTKDNEPTYMSMYGIYLKQ